MYEERYDRWLHWQISGKITAPPVKEESLTGPFVIHKTSTLTRASYFESGQSLDATTPFASRYRTGVTDLGSPNMKVVRELVADGVGAVNASMGVAWKTQPAGTALALGTSPLVAQARSRTAARGRNFRVQFDATSGAWSLNRFALHVRSQRPVGVKQT